MTLVLRSFGLRSARDLVAAACLGAVCVPAGCHGVPRASRDHHGPDVVPARRLQIAAGWRHTCALILNGDVRCWGANDHGQLGDGTVVSKSAPVAVLGSVGNAVALSAGLGHTCAVVSGGRVLCWGLNDEGQLGDGTTSSSNSPVSVVGLSGVTAISAGDSHTCALTVDGITLCWGANDRGQLGDGSTTTRLLPVKVDGLPSCSRVSAGNRHTCAVSTSGISFCWGLNIHGELGDGGFKRSSAPVKVLGLGRRVLEISCGGYHTCLRTDDDEVRCWGLNDDGQLGDGGTVNRPIAAPVVGLSSSVTAVAGGYAHSCAVTGSGLQCWGGNQNGQLGDGSFTNRHLPTRLADSVLAASSVAVGFGHTCAVVGEAVYCWGRNAEGQVGDGSAIDRSSPVRVTDL